MEKRISEETKAAADRGAPLSDLMMIHESYALASGYVSVGKKIPKDVFAALLLRAA